MTAFDFTPLLPAGLPPAAVRWPGLAKYNFTGGNNDADEVPVDDLIAAEWQYELAYQPEAATAFGKPGHNDKLSDLSPAANRSDADERRKFLQQLEAIDSAGLSSQDQLNKELLVAELRDDLERYELKMYEMPIDQFWATIYGPLSWFPSPLSTPGRTMRTIFPVCIICRAPLTL